LAWMQEAFALRGGDAVLQKTPASFDVSVWELFWPLLTGAALVVARPAGHKDPAYLAELIRREAVTTLHFVPPMLAAFLEQDGLAESCASVRRVVASGEALSAATVGRFFERLPEAGLHNLYGPTEAAVDVSWHPCVPGEERVPIGRPIANLRLHVVDRHLEPQPVGVPGELLLGGVGLARGYLARPGLTAERFVPDPFAAELGSGEPAAGAGGRLYRTGDLARWLPGGEVEFLGRLDHQVKVRGHRIELGEIEAALAARGDLAAAVVLPTAGPAGDTRLTAYVVPAPGAEASVEAIHRDLSRRLPEAMIPGAFAVLDALPLTPNGKVDRRALAAVATRRLGRATPYVAPRNDTEERLAALWCDLLEVERVGVNDSFFHLGGHSLLATRLLGRVRDAFGVDLPLAAFFEAPTVADLAESLEVARWMTAEEPAPAAVGEEIEEGVL
ncbi:MAG TPA: AMP-binding protein, partial [Thermoanaerobaculia bacterium]|nr:AMP-binding protein [Thermoanaerobaculia bacterium]